MAKISKNFSREEFACKCGCGYSVVDTELLSVLERIRAFFNAPVTINSACRCPSHNKSEGGHPSSKHMHGIAADIIVQGVHPLNVYAFLEAHMPDKGGIGSYPTFTHVDVQSTRKRWHG